MELIGASAELAAWTTAAFVKDEDAGDALLEQVPAEMRRLLLDLVLTMLVQAGKRARLESPPPALPHMST